MDSENEQKEENTTNAIPEMKSNMPEMAQGVPSNDAAGEKKEKMSKKQVIGLVVLSLIAVGGVLFGIYGMNAQNEQIAQLKGQVSSVNKELTKLDAGVDESDEVVIEDEVEIIDDVISNELAQNLISPYLGTFTYLNDIFDHEFNETTKFYVAFNNLKDVYRRGDSITYDDINKEYKYLFGDSKDLDKVNYREGYSVFIYKDKDWGGGEFVINRLGGGGTMAGLFSVVKDAYYDDNDIVVEVYHDSIGVCGVSDEDDYCFNDNSVYRTIIDDEMSQIIENNSNRIPVYKMIFMSNGDHYYLNSIDKE